MSMILVAGLAISPSGGEVAVAQESPLSPAPGAESSVESLLRDAERARAENDMLRAAGLYARVLERDPGHRVALYNAGIILENAGKPELAAGMWQRALTADPGDLFAFEHLFRTLARIGGLEAVIEQIESQVAIAPDAQVPRLALALALQEAGRQEESVAQLESFLLAHPESNIAYTFLKDAFVRRADFFEYVREVGRRASRADAPESLKLLNIRLLLERGRIDEARALTVRAPWQSEKAITLLTRAELFPQTGSPAPEGEAPPIAAARPPEEGAADAGAPAPRASEGGEEPEAVSRPEAAHEPDEVEEPPDFGPDDPRSAPLHLARTRSALEEQDESRAILELRRAVHAAPLRLQPRILLALLLDQKGRREEAREALRGPVETSPWDLYQQAWRTVRDDFFDPDHAGVDIYRHRRLARDRVRTVEDAQREVGALLASLNDPYAHLFEPSRFAGYLLAPNANRLSGPREPTLAEIADPWIPIPAEPEEPAQPDRRLHALQLRPSAQAVPEGASAAGPAPEPGEGAVARPGSEAAPLRPEEGPRAGVREPPASPDGATAAAPGEAETTRSGGSEPEPPDEPRPLPRDPGMRAARLADDIGYLVLPSLGGLSVPRQVEDAVAGLGQIRGLILDLRGNGGGDGTIAVEVAARFLPRGSEVCVYLTRRGPQRQVTTWAPSRRPQVPLVVLVDGETASAAELLAVALRDQAGATLVGRRTAGKGVGQKALLLPDGSGLSLTRFRLQGPSGAVWDGVGLPPSVPVPVAPAPDGEDPALETAHATLLALSGGAPDADAQESDPES
jgi:C-terminal processing protease CtpA/Prc